MSASASSSLKNSDGLDRPFDSPQDRRARAVLHRVVDAYLEAGEPVSSAEVLRRGVEASAATIRKVMADLEAAGFLAQPHTSAGRVPTEAALRHYLAAGVSQRLHPWDRTQLDEAADTPAAQLAASLGHRLAGLSREVVVLAVPRFLATTVQEIGLVRIDARRLLATFVSRSGLTQQKMVDVDFEPSAEELVHIQNFLNARLAHKSILEVRGLIQRELANVAATYDRLRQAALRIGLKLVPEPELEIVVDGAAGLAEKPEFADRDKLRAVLMLLEDKHALLQLIERVLDGQGVQVVLGLEPAPGRELALACVGTHCAELGWSTPAVVSVLGPARMDYGRLLPLVDYTARLFDRFWQHSGHG